MFFRKPKGLPTVDLLVLPFIQKVWIALLTQLARRVQAPRPWERRKPSKVEVCEALEAVPCIISQKFPRQAQAKSVRFSQQPPLIHIERIEILSLIP